MLERRSAVLRVAGRSLDPPSHFSCLCCCPCFRACYPRTHGGRSPPCLECCMCCSYAPQSGGPAVDSTSASPSPHVPTRRVRRVTGDPAPGSHGLRSAWQSLSTGISCTALSHIPVGEEPVVVAQCKVNLKTSRQRCKCKQWRKSRRKTKSTENPLFAAGRGREVLQRSVGTSGTQWLGRLFLWLGLLWEITGPNCVHWNVQAGSRRPRGVGVGRLSLCVGVLLVGIGAVTGAGTVAPPSGDLLNPWISPHWLSLLRANHTSNGGANRSLRRDGGGSCPGLGSASPSWNPPAPACPSTRCETERLFHDDPGFNATPAASASQCLPYLSDSHQDCICAHSSGAKRIDVLRKTYLRHCYHYNLWHVLSDTLKEGIAQSSDQCYTYLRYLQELDELAEWITCEFDQVMRRYDCGQTFSVRSTCRQCQTAYRNWVCSMVIPFWTGHVRVKPCRNFCHQVEQLCPYFLPAEKTGSGSQYAGEPAFLCIDPDVLQTQLQAENSAHGPDSMCYRPCTLHYGLEPDIAPEDCSLSFPEMVTNGSGGRASCGTSSGSHHVLGNYSQVPGSSGVAVVAASSSTFSSSSSVDWGDRSAGAEYGEAHDGSGRSGGGSALAGDDDRDCVEGMDLSRALSSADDTLSTLTTLTPAGDDSGRVVSGGDFLTNASPTPLYSFAAATGFHWTRVLSPVVLLSLVTHLLA